MSKKLYGALLPLFAVAAFVIVPAAAQAEFHWYVNGTRLPFTSAKTQVITGGTLTLTANNGITVKCGVLDSGNIWNVSLATSGKDEINAFINYECESIPTTTCPTVSIAAKGLPWPTELAAGPVDKIGTVAKPIEVTVNCSGTLLTFAGTLSPKIINATATEPAFAEFTAATGELENAEKTVKAKVTGKDRLAGFNGEAITVLNP
jgi:hypothetical protein